jgi:uncharacterized membrane protein
MEIVLVALQFAHIATGAAWFGASVFANVAVLPYIAHQPPARQRELVGHLILGPERILIAAALGAAVTGLVRGIAFGRIESAAALATPYGIVWLASIVIAVVVFATGGRVTSRAARMIRDNDAASDPEVAEMFARLRVGFRVELAGIAAILAAMVLLPRL